MIVFVACGEVASFLKNLRLKLVWSFLLAVENPFCFFAYGSLPGAEIGFGRFCLQFPRHKRKRRTVGKKTLTVSKKTHPWALVTFFFEMVQFPEILSGELANRALVIVV